MRYRTRAWICVLAVLFQARLYAGSGAHNAVDEALFREAGRIVQSLDDRLLAAQVIMTGIDRNVLDSATENLLHAVPAGAIMLFRYNLAASAEQVSLFLQGVSALTTAGTGGIAPFIAVDHEGGSVYRFSGGVVSRLPAPGSYGEAAKTRDAEAVLREVEADAKRSGEELRAIGVSVNLAPVAEVLTEENRAFLDDRSYGPNARFTTTAAAAFVRGMEAAGVACAIKHFPGHAGGDPHKRTVIMNGDRESLARLVEPFAELIRRRPAMVMVSHALVPAWDKERNASLSPAVIGQWLREELGYEGIVLADDFSMAALAGRNPETSVVEALNAGADMVMAWPLNLRKIHQAIFSALNEGRLDRSRLEDAAKRIIAEKLRRGLVPFSQEEG
ncbi:MAG: glycoside hydrolase family 3 protein [Treponema sp.]|jgi:beta-N-acetylhexosaminidase|nr:glycoside hydrolase family 3 protein [Treponema sp.]